MKIWIALAAAAAFAAYTAVVYSYGVSAGASGTEAVWQKRENDELRRANETIERLNREARAREAKHQQAVADISARYQEDLRHAEDQRKRDVAAARSGALRLRDAGATCKANGGGGEGAAGAAASGRDAETGAELSREVTANLYELVADADAVTVQLGRAQDLVREYYAACR